MASKARKAKGQRTPPALPLDKARELSKFTSLKGRGVFLGLVPSGVEVVASSPAELDDATDRELIKRAGETSN